MWTLGFIGGVLFWIWPSKVPGCLVLTYVVCTLIERSCW